MNTEVLIFRNVTAGSGGPDNILENVSLTLNTGELLGVYGMGRRQRGLFFDLILRRRLPTCGTIHHCYAVDASGTDVLMLMSRSSFLVDNMSIWENVLIFRSARSGRVFFDPGGAREYAAEYIREFLPDVPVHMDVYRLTRIQRLILEMLCARLLSPRILMLDDASYKYTAAEAAAIKKVISALTREGISLILVSQNINTILSFSDRIAFFHSGIFLRHMKNGPESLPVIKSLLPTPAPAANITSRPPRARRELARIDRLILGGRPFSLELPRGEVSVLYDPGRQTIRAVTSGILSPGGCQLTVDGTRYRSIRSAIRRNRFCFFELRASADTFVSNLIVESMPIRENACLPFFKRISFCSILRQRSMRFIEEEFLKWSGMDELPSYTKVSDLNNTEKIRLALFKLYMTKPTVILCKCPTLIGDSDLRLISAVLGELAHRHNCAVAFFVPEVDAFPTVADNFYSTGALPGFHPTTRAEIMKADASLPGKA